MFCLIKPKTYFRNDPNNPGDQAVNEYMRTFYPPGSTKPHTLYNLHFYDWWKKDSFFINLHNVVNHWKSCIKGVGIGGFFQSSYSTSQTKRQWPLSAVHDGNISPGEVGVSRPTLSTITSKGVVYAPLERDGTLPLFPLYPFYVLSGRIFQDFFLPWLMHGWRISKEDLPFLLSWN